MWIGFVGNQKGGVGKTTTAVTVAHGLAVMDYRVLLVDLDAQGNVGDALGLGKRGGLYDLLFSENGQRCKAVDKTGRTGLDVILGDKTTAEAKHRLAGVRFREYALSRALQDLRQDYDVCILDAAPGVDVLQIGGLVACDAFLVPVALSHLALVGVRDAMETAAALASVGGGVSCGRFLGVLPTFWDRTTRESHRQLQALAGEFGALAWPPIPVDVKAREAPAFGRTLLEYVPRGRAVRGVKIKDKWTGGYLQVVQRLEREIRAEG